MAITVPISILAIIIILTNTAVATLILITRSLRTCTNTFVVSLAVSDILVGVALFIQYTLNVSAPIILNVMYSTALLCSVANLGTVSLDRYIAVVKPFNYCNTVPRYFAKIILTTWITALLTALLPIAWSGNTALTVHKVYQFCVLVFAILLPYVLIFISYWRIYRQVRKCVRRERRLTKTVVVAYHQKKLSTEAKIAKVFAVVCLTFVLAWLPIIWATAVVALGRLDLIPKEFTYIAPFTLAFGSIINPVLYAFMKPDIRNALLKVLPTKFSRLSAYSASTQHELVEYSTYKARTMNNNV